MNEIRVILSDYRIDPATRHIAQDVYKQGSGEEFRDSIVAPAFEKAVKEGCILVVDIGNTWGVPPSFREETFGGLVRLHRAQGRVFNYRDHLTIVSETEPDDIRYAWQDIEKMVAKYNREVPG